MTFPLSVEEFSHSYTTIVLAQVIVAIHSANTPFNGSDFLHSSQLSRLESRTVPILSQIPSKGVIHNAEFIAPAQPSKLMLPLVFKRAEQYFAASLHHQSSLVSGPVGTHDHIFVQFLGLFRFSILKQARWCMEYTILILTWQQSYMPDIYFPFIISLMSFRLSSQVGGIAIKLNRHQVTRLE
jgi:hypothetical protein